MKQDGSPSTNHWNDKFDRMKEKNMGKKKTEYKRTAFVFSSIQFCAGDRN